MKKILASAAALTVAFASHAAFAEDADWSGPYAGVTAGISQHQMDAQDGDQYLTYGSLKADKTGFTGGVTLGYNFQSGNFVGGLEGDFNLNTGKSKAFGWDNVYYSASSDPKWTASVRARAGLAFGNVMPYITGGLAVANVGRQMFYDYTACSDSPGYDTICEKHTDTGLIVGAGVEAKVGGNGSVKLEYLRTSLNKRQLSFETDYPVTFNDDYDTFRIGYNYHF